MQFQWIKDPNPGQAGDIIFFEYDLNGNFEYMYDFDYSYVY